jgi:hypothetical protein
MRSAFKTVCRLNEPPLKWFRQVNFHGDKLSATFTDSEILSRRTAMREQVKWRAIVLTLFAEKIFGHLGLSLAGDALTPFGSAELSPICGGEGSGMRLRKAFDISPCYAAVIILGDVAAVSSAPGFNRLTAKRLPSYGFE